MYNKNMEARAVWDTAYINDLPDSAFLYIESGGTKDNTGKTTPRSLRHFPYEDAAGNIDLPHLRNALSRIPQSNLPQSIKDELTKKAEKLLANAQKKTIESSELETRSCGNMPVITRVDGLSGEPAVVRVGGYAALFNVETQLCRWLSESIAPGAFAESLAAGDDVRCLFNHDDNLVLGRTKANTLRLLEDATGLRYEVDLPNTTVGLDLAKSIQRGDVSGSSFAIQCLADKLDNSDPNMARRTILRAKLFDVSPCTYPAYQDTTVALRSAREALEETIQHETDVTHGSFKVICDLQRRLDRSRKE